MPIINIHLVSSHIADYTREPFEVGNRWNQSSLLPGQLTVIESLKEEESCWNN